MAWIEPVSANEYQAKASVHRKGMGWSAPEVLGSTDAVPNVGVAADGSALAMLHQGTSQAIVVKRYRPQTGWGETPELTISPAFSNSRLVMNPAGHALVVSAGAGLTGRYHTPAGGWRDPVRLDDLGSAVSGNGYEVLLEGAGSAHVVWSGGNTLWTRRFEYTSN